MITFAKNKNDLFLNTSVLDILQREGLFAFLYGDSLTQEYEGLHCKIHKGVVFANIDIIKLLFSSYFFEVKIINNNFVIVKDKTYLEITKQEDSSLEYIFELELIPAVELILDDPSFIETLVKSRIYSRKYLTNFDTLIYIHGKGLMSYDYDVNTLLNFKEIQLINNEIRDTEVLFHLFSLYLNNKGAIFSEGTLKTIKEYINNHKDEIKKYNKLDFLLDAQFPDKALLLKDLGVFALNFSEMAQLFDIKTDASYIYDNFGKTTILSINPDIKDKYIKIALLFYHTGKINAEKSVILGVTTYHDFEKVSINILEKYYSKTTKEFKIVAKLLLMLQEPLLGGKFQLYDFIVRNNINNKSLFLKYYFLRQQLFLSQKPEYIKNNIILTNMVYDEMKEIFKSAWTVFDINIDDNDILDVLEDANDLLKAKNIARSIILRNNALNKKEILLDAIISSTQVKTKDIKEEFIKPEVKDNTKKPNNDNSELIDDLQMEKVNIVIAMNKIDIESIKEIMTKNLNKTELSNEECATYSNWNELYEKFNSINKQLNENGALSEEEINSWKNTMKIKEDVNNAFMKAMLPSDYLLETDTELFEIIYSQID